MIKEKVETFLKTVPASVTVIAATKQREPYQIIEAIKGGIKIIGENYVREAEKKYPFIPKGIQWHLIGGLQKNKVKKAVRLFDVIQSVDTQEIAELINQEAERLNKIMPVMVEVNIAQEPQKRGIIPSSLKDFISTIITLPYIKVIGLMTMGPLVFNPEDIRPYFRRLNLLFKELRSNLLKDSEFNYLSMGMSDSYKIAIEEGANMIRIGRAIFGER